MSIEISFKRKIIKFVEDGKNEYRIVDEPDDGEYTYEVDPGEVDDEDLFRYRS